MRRLLTGAAAMAAALALASEAEAQAIPAIDMCPNLEGIVCSYATPAPTISVNIPEVTPEEIPKPPVEKIVSDNIWLYQNDAYHKMHLQARRLRILRRVSSPAVYLEPFNLQDPDQARFFMDSSNVEELAQAYTNAAVLIRDGSPEDGIRPIMPGLLYHVLDDGHGTGKAAEITHDGILYRENDFSWMLQDALARHLEDADFIVKKLNYVGNGQNARLAYFEREAKWVDGVRTTSRNSMYWAIHANSFDPDKFSNRNLMVFWHPLAYGKTKKMATIVYGFARTHWDHVVANRLDIPNSIDYRAAR